MMAARSLARPSFDLAKCLNLELICQPDCFIRVNARKDVPEALGLDRRHVGQQLGETAFVDVTKLGEQVQSLRSKGRQHHPAIVRVCASFCPSLALQNIDIECRGATRDTKS